MTLASLGSFANFWNISGGCGHLGHIHNTESSLLEGHNNASFFLQDKLKEAP